jgi:hypothetical protein
VPIELAECGSEIVADESVVVGVGCASENIPESGGSRFLKKHDRARVLGIKIFRRWEDGSDGSRFFEGSRKLGNSEIAEADNGGSSRSPRKAAQCENAA